MSEKSRPVPAYNNNNTTSSLPVVNLSNENGAQGNAQPISSNSNPAPAPSSQDEYAVLETLFYNEMVMMGNYYGNSGSGLLNHGDMDALIENNTNPNNALTNAQSKSADMNPNNASNHPTYASVQGVKNDPNQNKKKQNVNTARRAGSSNIDVDQHAHFLGTTSIPSINNAKFPTNANGSNDPNTTMNRPGLVHPNSTSIPHTPMQNQQHHQQAPPHQLHPPAPQQSQQQKSQQQQQQQQPLPLPQSQMQQNQNVPKNMSSTRTNPSLHGHTVGPKPVVVNQQMQQNGQIHIISQHHQPPKANGQQGHTLLGQTQQNWSSSALPQMQDVTKIDSNASNGNQIPSQPSLPNQNQSHSHQTHFPPHHQNHLSAPILAHPQKQSAKPHPGTIQQPKHQQIHHHQNHPQHPQRHINQMQHPLPAPMQHRAPLSSPSLQLLSPPQQIQNGSFQQQNQDRQPQPKQNQMHHQKQQQSRPMQPPYQIQNKGNHHQQYVQQLRQPPQLQPPQQYNNQQKPQQTSHQQQYQSNNIKPHPQYQPQPQPPLQQKPQLQQPQLQAQTGTPMQPQYQVQQQHQPQQQKLQPLSTQHQYIPQQKMQQSQPMQPQQHVQKKQPNKIHPPQHQQKPYPNHNQMQPAQIQQRMHPVQPNHPYSQQQQSHPPQQHQTHNALPQNEKKSNLPVQNMQQYQMNQHHPTTQPFKAPVSNQFPRINSNQQHLQQPHLIHNNENTRSVQGVVPQNVASTQNDPQHEQRARQLVSQFASLATQLGIALPESVFSSLTRAATIREVSGQNNESKLTPGVIGKNGIKSSDLLQGMNAMVGAATSSPRQKVTPQQPVSSSSIVFPTKTTDSHITKPPSVQHPERVPLNGVSNALENPTIRKLEETANAAIAAISSSKIQPSSDAGNIKDSMSVETTPSRTQSYTRKRKRPRLEDCMQKLAVLRNENETLKRHLAIVANKTQKFDMERKLAEQELREMVKNCSAPEKMNVILEKFTRMYSDFGQHRHEELGFHLGQLEKLAIPTNFTKMALWTLGQENEFFFKPKRNAISGILMDELGITPIQGRKIIEHRATIKSICGNIKQALSLLTTLKALCEHKQNVFKARMTKCREILTPLQVCKLLIWIDDNWGLLDQVCPGWGAEQRVKNKSIEVDTNSSVNSKDISAPDNRRNFEEEMVKLQEIGAGDETDDSSAAS